MSIGAKKHPLRVMREELHVIIDRYFDQAEARYASRPAATQAVAKRAPTPAETPEEAPRAEAPSAQTTVPAEDAQLERMATPAASPKSDHGDVQLRMFLDGLSRKK